MKTERIIVALVVVLLSIMIARTIHLWVKDIEVYKSMTELNMLRQQEILYRLEQYEN